jgi:hypothetical protein
MFLHMALFPWASCARRREKRTAKHREEVRLEIETHSDRLKDALYLAEVAGEGESERALMRAAPAFLALGELAAQLDTATEEKLDWISYEADEIGPDSAYLVPADTLHVEALTMLHDLQEWKLPPHVMQTLRGWDDQIEKMALPEHVRRRALRKLLIEYDYWDDEVDDHARFLARASRVLVPACILFTVAAIACVVVQKWVVAGFVLAGTAGAALSILLKLPPVAVYGETIGAWGRMFARLAAGVIASTIGLGLLASGFVSLGVPQGGERFVSPAAVLNACLGEQPGTDCTTPNVLALLAVAIVVGFSERALASFEGAIMPRGGNDGGAVSQERPES